MDGSIPSSNAFAGAHKLAPITDEVSKKLRGGVWERSELARSAYSSVLELGRWLSRQGITPNALTYVALAFAVGSGVAAAAGAYLAVVSGTGWLSTEILPVAFVWLVIKAFRGTTAQRVRSFQSHPSANMPTLLEADERSVRFTRGGYSYDLEWSAVLAHALAQIRGLARRAHLPTLV